MHRILSIIALCAALFPLCGEAAQLFDHFPRGSPARRGMSSWPGSRRRGPKAGAAEVWTVSFPGHQAGVVQRRGFNLIAYQRPKNGDFEAYVETLKFWVKRLAAAGVAPSRMSLVRFSRGGQATAYASSDLASTGINTALLAICAGGDFQRDPPLVLDGNLLSIYETSHEMGSCTSYRSATISSLSRKSRSQPGGGHGAFF